MKHLAIILFVLTLGVGANAQTVNEQTSAIAVPTAKAVTLRDAICYEHGYTDTIVNAQGQTVPNHVSKATFAQQVMDDKFKQWLTNTYKTYVEKEALKSVDSSPGINGND